MSGPMSERICASCFIEATAFIDNTPSRPSTRTS
jgi:hypothetical protein